MSKMTKAEAFKLFANQLGLELNLKFLRRDDQYCFNTGFVNGDQVYTLRWLQTKFVSDDQQSDIENVFPITVGDFKFNYNTVFDYDYDDERDYLPAVGFTLEGEDASKDKNLNEFIYWN